MNLRPRASRDSLKKSNKKTGAKRKISEKNEPNSNECSYAFSVKVPKLDNEVFLYYANKTDQAHSKSELSAPQNVKHPVFTVVPSEKNQVKKSKCIRKVEKIKEAKELNKVSDNKDSTTKSQEQNEESTSLPDIREAQVVNDESHECDDTFINNNLPTPLNEVAFSENDVNSNVIDVKIDGITNEELREKLKKRLCERKKNEKTPKNDLTIKNNESRSNVENVQERNEDENGNTVKEVCLKKLFEKFLQNSQIEKFKNLDFLKKGLCLLWLTNNFKCSNENCIYTHNAEKLFLKKLKIHPSKFVLILVVSMKDDVLFVDIIMAAFKVLSQRKIPMLWITFLVYLVFYLTDPADRRFLKFWANAARFFCRIKQVYGAANGFASLLCIFSQGDESDDWKIIEFIKVIQKPPIQLRVTFALLNPILEKKLPTSFLIAAVESAIETEVDIMKVYLFIIPKISLKTLPIDGVEVLFKFCEALRSLDENQSAENLKQLLLPKVQEFKKKIAKEDFPLTAEFQEKLNKVSANTYTVPLENSKDLEEKIKSLGFEDCYFKPKKQLFNKIFQKIESGSSKILPAYQIQPTSVKKTKATFDVTCDDKIARAEQIEKALFYFNNQKFDTLGKYLNGLRYDAQLLTAEEILKLLFRMKMSLQQVVDLVKLLISLCSNQSAAKVVGSITLTLVLNMVKIGEWNKAYALTSACLDKQINLVEAAVFESQEFISFTQLKIALVIVELYLHKKNFNSVLEFVKKHSLHSPNRALWKMTWKDSDEIIRVQVIEDFMWLLVLDHSSDVVFELFQLILKEQKEVHRPIDLNKFASDVFSLLLNQNTEEAVHFYEKVKFKFALNDNVIRSVLISLVRQKQYAEAKNLLLFYNQSIYILPQVNFGTINVKIFSSWLEEEIYVYFDCLFDLLTFKKKNKGFFCFSNYGNFEVLVEISTEEIIVPTTIIPLSLSLVDSSLESAYMRIQRVLKNQFKPGVSVLECFDFLKLDEESLKIFLNNRFSSAGN